MNKAIPVLLAVMVLTGTAACGKTQQPVPNGSGTSSAASSVVSNTPDTKTPGEPERAVKSILTDKKEVSISFWTGTGTANYPFLEAMVDSFQQEYPNIKVDFSNQGPITELTDKLTQNILSKTTPTVSNLNSGSFAEYAASNAIIDLEPYYNDPVIGFSAEESGGFYANYIEAAKGLVPDGGMFGFPTNKKTTDVLVYNKTFFDAQGWSAPQTWDQVVDYCKVIKSQTGMPGFCYDTSYADAAFKNLTQQWGSPYLTSEGMVDINNDATIAALTFYKSNMDLGYFTLPALMPSAGGNNSSNGFVMEECYMFIGAAAGVPYAIPKEDAGQKVFELGIAPIPQKDSEKPIAFFKGEDYCIFSNSTQEERVAAWLLIKFLSDNAQNVEWLINTGNLPLTKSMLELPAYKSFLDTKADSTPVYYRAAAVNAALEMESFLTCERVNPHSAEIAAECGSLWQAIMIGGAPIESTLSETEGKLKKEGI